MNPYSISVLLFSFAGLLVTILALMKRKDEAVVRFMIFNIAAGGWGFFFFLWMSQNYSYDQELFLIRLAHMFSVFIPSIWIHFVFLFIGKKEPFKFFYTLNYSMAFVIFCFSHSLFFIPAAHSILGFKYYPSPGPLYKLFTLIFFILVPYAFYAMVKTYLSTSGEAKKQLGYLVIATIIAFTAGGTTFLPVYGIPFPLYLLFFMPVYPFFMGAALIRHGLFDTDKIVEFLRREKLAVLGTMAASLNHELRNPLYIAKGRVETHFDAIERKRYASLEEEIQKSRALFSTVFEQLSRALDIMQRFSDFAKPRIKISEQEKLIVKEMMNDVLPLIAHEVELNKIQITEAPLDGIAIRANRRHMEEIFFNLILNACHAMEKNGGELRIRANEIDEKVEIEISDTGPGISKSDQRKIFEPFYTTKEKGTGLGLYIAKQLVERNGGKISVKSKPGEGTTFTLEFKT